MAITAFFAAGPALWPHYAAPLAAAFAAHGLDVALSDRCDDPAAVDYIVFAPGGVIGDFSPFTRCKAVLNLWSGVERIVGNPTLTQPLCRMVDPTLTEGMVEWVTGHVLRHHLGIDLHILGQDGVWRTGIVPPLARERTVAVMGLGELGTACAQALAALRFNVIGWSRRQSDVPGVACRSGPAGLEATLRTAEILVLLLPLTAETHDLLDTASLSLLPPGAVILNPGRGGLIDDAALLAALDSGRVSHATLDVFRTEPLPAEHAFWSHPHVTVTPHIASETRPSTAALVVAQNVARGEAGEPFLHLVDRARGY